MKSYAQQVQHKTILAIMALRWTCQYMHARLHLRSVAYEVSILGGVARANMVPPCWPEEHVVTLQATHPQLGKLEF